MLQKAMLTLSRGGSTLETRGLVTPSTYLQLSLAFLSHWLTEGEWQLRVSGSTRASSKPGTATLWGSPLHLHHGPLQQGKSPPTEG